MNEIRITILTSLYKCERYLEGYFYNLSLISGLDKMEVLLLHNEPSDMELEIIGEYLKNSGENIRHIIIEKRESLYQTWNRGISLAKGEYIAIWNVDDVRLPDSLERQAKVLDDYLDNVIVE